MFELTTYKTADSKQYMYKLYHETDFTDTAHKFKQAYTLVSNCTSEKVHYSTKLLEKSRMKRTAPPPRPKNVYKSQWAKSRLLK